MEILEFLGAAIEAAGCLLEGGLGALDLFSVVGDGITWWQSRDNRRARRAAKRAGAKPPPRTSWTVAYDVFLLISTLALVATFIVVVYRVLR